MPPSPVTVVVDDVHRVITSIRELAGTDVLVGIPEENASRQAEPGEQPSPMTNAVIGYIQENGSPEMRIPARPWLTTGVRDYVPQFIRRAGQIAAKVGKGDADAVRRGMEVIGLEAQVAVRRRLQMGPWQPLADSTLRARARRAVGRGLQIVKGARRELARRAAGEAPSSEFARPLIDTAQLRNAVNYVVRRGRKG